jgi:predicted methyltransferase
MGEEMMDQDMMDDMMSVLDDPTRPDDERAQDAGRRALEVYDFFGVEEGQVVADVFPGGGYNTHLLSRIVGAEGRVLAVLGFYGDPDFFEGNVYTRPALEERIASAHLDNVTLVDELGEVEPESVDLAMSIRNYHDIEWFAQDWKRADTVAALYRMMKPGGVVGIVEVATHHEGWHQETHRLNQQVVIDDFTAGGFELVDTSDLLANPDDDHSVPGFREGGRHTMDRYVLKFRKPTM